jgi:hypothetical protein
VLQSLIRKKTSTENVWEALLEFNGPEEVPHDETQLEWVGGKLRSIDPEGCQRCNLELYIPTYFRRVPHVPKCRDYPIFDRSKEDQSLDPNFDLDPLRAERRKDRIPARRWLYELSDNYQASGRKPTVFFSYPYVAEKQANLVIQLLKKSNFDPKMYQPGMGPSGTIMVATVIELIRGADYFLGLWHPEANDPSTISPWLLFEFGVARALNKDCVFMCHEGLRQEVVLRIEKDRHQIKYNDLYFIRDSLEQLQDYCNHNWVDVR